MRWWHRIHDWPRRARWPLKLALFLAIVVIVLYPRLDLLVQNLRRLSDLNSVLQPDQPGLAPFEADVARVARLLRARRPGDGGTSQPVSAAALSGEVTSIPSARDLPLDELLPAVERTVYARIPYAYDWDTWGVMDHLPTVDEVLAKGRDDCDGRAVVAASLLRRLGWQAYLVNDLKHVWVIVRPPDPNAAPRELMSPGTGAKSMSGGGEAAPPLAAQLANLGNGLAFGIMVFPLLREVIILAALIALTLQPRASVGRRVVGALLLVAALVCLRSAGIDPRGLAARPALPWLGLLATLAGWLLLAIPRRPARIAITRPVLEPVAESESVR